jgi:D-beta-D-heptose 7-phosphate kinase/D-beta-D-heptose 1-phosphate adenosyltransferase
MKILIIGEICEDVFIYGDVNRLSPEAPIPVIEPKSETKNKGMAGNVESNLKALGFNTHLISNNELMRKIRYVDDSYNYILLRIDENNKVSNVDIDAVLKIEDIYDAVVIVDYDKGFLKEEDILKISTKFNCHVFMDTKKILGEWCKEIDYIKVNYSEYLKSKSFIEKSDWIKNKLIVTRGKYGCDYNGKNFPTKDVSIKDVAGAGDTFLSGLIFKYIQTNSIEQSIRFANLCSTQVVQKRGVSIIDKNLL